MSFFKCGKFSFELGRKTYIMGILNVTPDSFSDGGDFFSVESAVKRAVDMQNEHADIIDIGGQSTRPGCTAISAEEELKRLIPVLEALTDKISIPISVDTFFPQVAAEAIRYGASIINDVSGFSDNKMIKTAANSDCGCIIMHSGNGTVEQISEFLLNKANELKSSGIEESRICFDAGIGFGKNEHTCLEILRRTNELKFEQYAYLSAVSRKRVIGYAIGNPDFKERLYGTISANTVAVMGGADILRVHDVAAAVQAARVTDAILRKEI